MKDDRISMGGMSKYSGVIEDWNETDFAKKVIKIHKAMSMMEKTKYLEPLLSWSFDLLSAYYQDVIISDLMFRTSTWNNLY